MRRPHAAIALVVVLTAVSFPAIAADDAAVMSFLEKRVRLDPDDTTALNRLANEYLLRFRVRGDDLDLTRALDAATQSLRAVPADVNTGGLAAHARAAFSLHQFSAALEDARRWVALEPDKPQPYQALGDALLELGNVPAAARAYQQMSNRCEPDAGTESRLSRLAFLRGETESARDHMARAVELAKPLTSPETLVWCHVQTGQLAFACGDWGKAEESYQAALAASPSDWRATEHLAELRAAQKQWDVAVALYSQAIDRAPRPELMQALGDVYAAMGRADDARAWHRRALQKYREACEAGHAHYYHHLAGYYCDAEPNPAEAVKWARKDLAVRHSVYAYEALGWALYHDGQFAAAAEAMDKAVALGTRDAHVLYHASLVYYRAGDPDRARKYLAAATSANPKFNEFHAHR